MTNEEKAVLINAKYDQIVVIMATLAPSEYKNGVVQNKEGIINEAITMVKMLQDMADLELAFVQVGDGEQGRAGVAPPFTMGNAE